MHTLNEWLELFNQELKNIDAIQIGVLVFGVSEVLLARANNILLYPAGIIATVLALFSLYTAGLYAECLLHGYYLVMSVYGWWYWSKRKHEPPVAVTFANRYDWIVTTCFVVGGTWLLFFVLSNYTDSEVPVWDAWISATGWAGMWLLARRKVENWLLLNISNAFAVPLLFIKGLPLMALLTVFLFIVACIGYVDWRKTAAKKVVHSPK